MVSRLVPAQIRGARGVLNWSMSDLAQAADVSVSTVKRLEKGEPFAGTEAIRSAVRNALEAAGVRFIDDEGGTGLRFSIHADRGDVAPGAAWPEAPRGNKP